MFLKTKVEFGFWTCHRVLSGTIQSPANPSGRSGYVQGSVGLKPWITPYTLEMKPLVSKVEHQFTLGESKRTSKKGGSGGENLILRRNEGHRQECLWYKLPAAFGGDYARRFHFGARGSASSRGHVRTH
jgi:hypothetical protein